MIDKNEFIETSKIFSYKIRNNRNAAIYLGDSIVLGNTVTDDPIIINSHHFNSLKLLYLPPVKEIAVMSFLYHFIKPNMICADIGAGTGYYSMVLSKLIGSTGRVYSFEGDKECFSLLKRNARLNEFTSLFCINSIEGLDDYFESHSIDLDLIHISPEIDLPKIYADLQKVINANESICLLCHIDPKKMESSSNDYDNLFSQLNSNGFEGYLFPSLNFLGSKEQLTSDLSIKSLLLCRSSPWSSELREI